MGFNLIYLTFLSGKYFFVGGSALDIILEKLPFFWTATARFGNQHTGSYSRIGFSRVKNIIYSTFACLHT